MCLMFLMCWPVTLVVMSELLLVRCKIAGLLACKRPRQGLAKGPLVKQTRHQRTETKESDREWTGDRETPRLWLVC